MAAPDITGIATAFTALIDAANITLDGSGLVTYATEPRDFGRLPGLAVRFNRFQRRDLDAPDVQLGGAHWELEYVVTVAVPLDDPQRGQEGIATVIAAVIDTVDADPSLGRVDVDDAVLVSGTIEFTDDENLPRQLAVAECQLAVLALST